MQKKSFIFTILILGILFPFMSQAVCPVCTIAVGAGVGLCRYLGVNDLVSGVWVGGLVISMALWIINWLNKKNIHFKFRRLSIIILTYLIVVVPLYWMGIMGHPNNKFLGIDRLLFGIISGSIIFVIAVLSDKFLRSKNQGKVFSPFQKVILPILFLLINSLIFYFFFC